MTLRLATLAVLVETVVVAGYVGFLIYVDADQPGAWRVIGYFALYVLAFAGLSWGLIRRRRWVRAPLIVLQMLLVATGLGLLNGGTAPLGVVVIAFAVACAALLLAPGTRVGLTRSAP